MAYEPGKPEEVPPAGDLAAGSATDRDGLLKETYELQLEIAELNRRLAARKKRHADLYDLIAALGRENDPKSEFQFVARVRQGNRFIVPSRFALRFPEIFAEKMDTLVTITLGAAKEFVPEKHLEPVISRKDGTTVYSVEYVPLRAR